MATIAKKKKYVYETFKKFPDLKLSVVAARHHMSLPAIQKWKKEYDAYIVRLEKRKK